VSLPAWVFEINFAELTEWSVKPWEVGELPLMWFIRLQEYYRIKNRLGR
jgi:hypothetical protein